MSKSVDLQDKQVEICYTIGSRGHTATVTGKHICMLQPTETLAFMVVETVDCCVLVNADEIIAMKVYDVDFSGEELIADGREVG